VEEVGEGEDADAPKGPLKQLPGDYRFAREQDCDLRLFDFESFGGFGKEVRSTLRLRLRSEGPATRGSCVNGHCLWSSTHKGCE
jgi:hypothetical protein